MNRLFYLLLLTLIPFTLTAEESHKMAPATVDSGALSIENGYVREVPPVQKTSAAFMQICNSSDTAIKLLAAESAVAEFVELHNHIMQDGMMQMRKVDDITIPANGCQALAPGGYHIMLIQLTTPLKREQSVNMELVFDNQQRLAIALPVTPIMQQQMQHNMQHHHH